ncbi:hypothetical protein [Pelagerythrobacter rhizovicinus]|uniref:Uncharacterized protein n=1 Tax=Pelagerythrobacter rhizovicinus TaxID=2268576 RepID=A0A4Q2KQN9_9SPHN|nr:hypothetical protein [Pelagerythrobacter rhizovicinus]RXZ65952.1 hypothetical protein ETX26_04315 [Pelagerythrobacter rhizovicinus]
MKTCVRLGASATAGILGFATGVLGIEYLAWFYAGPTDILLDPAINAGRFAVAAAVGVAAAFLSFPRATGGRQ